MRSDARGSVGFMDSPSSLTSKKSEPKALKEGRSSDSRIRRSPCLPSQDLASGLIRRPSPVTATGSCRIFTGFPQTLLGLASRQRRRFTFELCTVVQSRKSPSHDFTVRIEYQRTRVFVKWALLLEIAGLPSTRARVREGSRSPVLEWSPSCRLRNRAAYWHQTHRRHWTRS